MTVIDALIELQDVDGRIRDLELQLKDLPRRKALAQARLTGSALDLDAAKASLASANDRVQSFEEERKAGQEKLQQLKISQLSLKTNKEYAQFSTQIDMTSQAISAAQNNAEAALSFVPTEEDRVNRAQAAFDSIKSAVEAECAEFDQRISEAENELSEAKADRIAKADEVKRLDTATRGKFLVYYERLRTKRWPVIAPLTPDGVCDGCHLVQPPSVSQLANANAKNGEAGKPQAIVACTMCGRILYR